MKRTIAAMVAIAALAVPSVAMALSRVLHGRVGSGGVATIDIQFNIKHGRATTITRLEMNNVPASCKGFPSTATYYSFPHHILISPKRTFRARDVGNGGRTTYMVSGRFITLRKATGKLRIKGTIPGCRTADTGLVSWTATVTH
jgi:polyisoprenoid-binding protein YceI